MSDGTEVRPDGEKSQQEEEQSVASEILADALGQVLNQPNVTTSIAALINSLASHKAQQAKIVKTSMLLGMILCCIIFFGISVLAWFKVLSGEATTGLLGALIGYWFGHRESGK